MKAQILQAGKLMPPSPHLTLQRRCAACGNHTVASGKCTECAKKKSALQRKLTIGASNDPLEREADQVVDQVMAAPAHSAVSGAPPRIQRFSGQSNGQMDAAPASVDRVLASPGRPLEPALQHDMGRRFGHNFSRVRVHSDAAAEQSARDVNAHAYTVGHNIVFGAGQYAPKTHNGRRLIAHELTHTLQQEGSVSRSVNQGVLRRIPAGSGRPSAAPGSSPTATTPAPAPVSVPPRRGTNPADCAEAVCRLATSASSANDAEATQRVDDWERATIACLRADGPASNASHQSEIVANEVGEVSADATELRNVLSVFGRGRHRDLDFRDSFRETCTRKVRELRIEFHYNVVFENPPGSTRWGYGSGDWDSIEQALGALPQEATWANPSLIRFSRAACHPNDLNAAGQCVGHSSGAGIGLVGGEADLSTGRITVFNAGLGSTPYSRSVGLRLPATQQTLRHEVGHLIMAQIAAADREEFFTQVFRWKDYSWAWITSLAPRYPNWQAERDSLRGELGFDEVQLDSWLSGLRPNAPIRVGDMTYTRDARGSGGATLFLSSVDATQLPGGVEFSYARTDRGEYLAELYALAVSRPEFLHNVLPPRQIEWLKRVVFRTPAPEEWVRRLAVRDVPPDLYYRLMRVFTREQAQSILDEIIFRQSAAGTQVA